MRKSLYLAAALLCAPAFSSPGLARGSDELLAILPEETMAFLSLHDLEAMRASASENAWFRFFQDEQMRPWIERLKQAMNQKDSPDDEVQPETSEPGALELDAEDSSSPEAESEDEVPFDIEEFVSSIHGSLVAFFVPVSDESEPGFGLLVEPGEERAEFDGYFDLVRDSFTESMVASEADYKEVPLELFEADNGAWNTLICFEADGLVAVVGSFGRENALELAQGMIDRIKMADESPAMLDRPELTEARQVSGALRHAEMFVDIPAFLKLVAATEEIPRGNEKILQLIGLRDVRWMHLSAGLGEGEELDLRLNVHIPKQGYLADWVGLLGPWPRALATLLPVESSSLSFVRFDVFGFYQSVFKLFEAVEPKQYAAVKGQIDALGQAYGIDIEADLLRQFTGEFASFNIEVPESEASAMLGWSEDGQASSDLNLGSATIVGLKDADAVEVFVDEVLSIFGADEMVEDEIFQGQVVYKLDTGGPFSLYWSYLDAGVVISPYPTALRSVLRRIGSEDAADALSNEKLSAPLAKVADAPVVTVTDTRVQLRTMLAAISALRDMLDGFDLSSGKLGDDLKLPDASVADKYFQGALLFALEKGDNSLGLRFSSF